MYVVGCPCSRRVTAVFAVSTRCPTYNNWTRAASHTKDEWRTTYVSSVTPTCRWSKRFSAIFCTGNLLRVRNLPKTQIADKFAEFGTFSVDEFFFENTGRKPLALPFNQLISLVNLYWKGSLKFLIMWSMYVLFRFFLRTESIQNRITCM